MALSTAIELVVVWLKIRKHDIDFPDIFWQMAVVVWLKIRKHDILIDMIKKIDLVVVWLKIRKHDIVDGLKKPRGLLWFDWRLENTIL